MNIVLDSEACVGHGRCYALAPEVYDADDEGHCLMRFGPEDSDPLGARSQGPARRGQLPRAGAHRRRGLTGLTGGPCSGPCRR